MINPTLHLYNRLAFGPRPEDLDGPAPGLEEYLDRQLYPERIPDSRVEESLSSLVNLSLTGTELLDKYPEIQDQYVAVNELTQAKFLRAVSSQRQLNEVMVDFWFNHFNVFAGKGICRLLLPSFERDAIRPHVFGRFRDMLGATARHPAMLFYLDNWLSASPTVRRARIGRRRGLNENYGRELLELHTLGVDGGYTQKDVVEVARSFTGWTLEGRRRPSFLFAPRLHDSGPKEVLGQRVGGSGIEEGEAVLDQLSRHPSTAQFISTKLVRRLVSDSPPPSLVRTAAETFLRTAGDLRQVVRSIVLSKEFEASEAQKVKTPFEFLVSSLRRVGAQTDNPQILGRLATQMGQRLYAAVPPTGYPDTADAWMSAGVLLTRLNIVTRLAARRLPGVTLPTQRPEDIISVLGTAGFQRR